MIPTLNQLPPLMFDEVVFDAFFQQFNDLKSFVNFSMASKNLFQLSQDTKIAISHSLQLRKFIFVRNVTYNNCIVNANFDDFGVKAFYELFNQRCNVLKINIDDQNFNLCMRAAVNHMSKILRKECPGKATKIATEIATEFGDKIYRDMVNSYADRIANQITIGSFASKVAQISNLFPKAKTIIAIETSLRQAIGKNHSKTFVNLSNDYFSMLIKKTNGFTLRRERYEQNLKGKAIALCGTGDRDKARDDAHVKMIEANLRLSGAVTIYLDYVDPFRRYDQFSSVETVPTLIEMFSKFKDPDSKLQLMGQEFYLLREQYIGAKMRFENLSLVCSKLDHLDEDFKREFAKIYKFYKEMSQVVTDDNKEERHIALHEILDS